MVRSARGAALAALGMVALATTACQPPPPRLALEVTTAANGSDDVPGDGVCASDAASGECTLQAAIEEGNTAPDGADIALPAGTYLGLNPTVTGDLRIDRTTPGTVVWSANVAVETGGRLELNGINASDDIGFPSLHITVRGATAVNRSSVGKLIVDPGGSAVLNTSIVGVGDEIGVDNSGTVIARSSSILAKQPFAPGGTPLRASELAVTYLAGSVLAQPDLVYNGQLLAAGGAGACVGRPPTSLGYVFVEITCGSPILQGDGSGPALITVRAGYDTRMSLDPASPLIDAIPLDDPACDPASTDIFGNERGVDGNGDGIGGCDIGAIERPADD